MALETLSVFSRPPYATAFLFVGLFYFAIYPLFVYFKDAKGLRKFHNLSKFSGAYNIPFMILARPGARSTHLVQLQREKDPVLRTGPNTLCFSDVRAIKDIYGHGTLCIKDESYVLTAGSHYHVADVVEKHDHARKRKVLSSAYALKNLEGWEHKVADKVERLFKQLDKLCSDPLPKGQMFPRPEDLTVDCRRWGNFFTLDAIADIGLSERLDLLDRVLVGLKPSQSLQTGMGMLGSDLHGKTRRALHQAFVA